MRIERRFTKEGQSPYAEIAFRKAVSEIRNPNGSVVFRLDDIDVPSQFSQVAADILAQKYFRKAGVPIALATDCNPGSSPVTSILLMLNMGCTLFRLTPEEALAGVTRSGAQALGLQDTHGTLEPGKAADFVLWDIRHPAELAYRIGFNPLHKRYFAGTA